MIASEPLTLLVKEVANRMKDPDQVNEIFFHPSNCNPDPLFPDRQDIKTAGFQLMGEYPGVLILLAELDRLFPDEKWDSAIHAYVLKVKEIVESKEFISLSLFEGLTGIAFALLRASRGGTRYQRMITILNAHLLEAVKQYFIIPLEENLNAHRPSRFSLYDLIQGVVGIGVYCLHLLHLLPFAELAKTISRLLILLAKPIEVEGHDVPGWYLPPHLQFLKEDQQRFPKGSFNLGLAHGIPGALAFLSIAILHGVEVVGQRETIQCLAAWLQDHRQENQGHLFWGTHVSFEEEIEQRKSKKCLSSKRNAWCYGTPGVSRSLFLAGKALGSEELKSFALDSFHSIFKQSREEWNLPSPTFCHGIAGLLMTTWIMYQDSGSVFLHSQAIMLKEILLEYYDPAHPFGFKNLDPQRKGGFAEISQLSLIEGASGILLTLLSLDGLSSWWHAPFLIAEGK